MRATRCKVYIPTLRTAWVALLVAYEALPEVGFTTLVAIDVSHDRLHPMAEILQHTADVALVVETHDHKTACAVGSLQQRW